MKIVIRLFAAGAAAGSGGFAAFAAACGVFSRILLVHGTRITAAAIAFGLIGSAQHLAERGAREQCKRDR